MIEYLLDTNICIYIIRQKPAEVFEKLKTLPLGIVGLSVITFSELVYGAEKSTMREKNLDALRRFVAPLEILNYSISAAIEYGTIRSNLVKQGAIIGAMDLLIASHAKSINACLVSNNLREFSRIPGLKTENWVN
jgi:tRNA(fMet)-specific endonuclease VapC